MDGLLNTMHTPGGTNVLGDVHLELLTVDHGPDLYEAVEPARDDLTKWFIWPDRVTSAAVAMTYIADIHACSRNRLSWLIYERHRPVGGVQLRMRKGGWAASLPYWLIPSARGRGVATKAVTVALSHAKQIGFLEAMFSIALDNSPSRKLAERLGFYIDGDQEDREFRGALQRVQVYRKRL